MLTPPSTIHTVGTQIPRGRTGRLRALDDDDTIYLRVLFPSMYLDDIRYKKKEKIRKSQCFCFEARDLVHSLEGKSPRGKRWFGGTSINTFSRDDKRRRATCLTMKRVIAPSARPSEEAWVEEEKGIMVRVIGTIRRGGSPCRGSRCRVTMIERRR